METMLNDSEREHLRLIADALQRKQSIEPDEELVGSLIRKCMVRTNGKELKITELGRRQLQS